MAIELDGMVTIGPAGVPQAPVLQAAPTQALLTQLMVQLNALLTILSAYPGTAPIVGVQAIAGEMQALAGQFANMTNGAAQGGCATQTGIG